MTISKSTKGLMKVIMACLLMLSFPALVPGAWAAHEAGNITSPDVPINTPTRWTDNLTVQWPALTTMGSDILNGYLYKWSNSASQLSDNVFNVTTGSDGTVDDPSSPSVVIDNSVLLGLDSGDLRYLHIKTWYTDNNSIPVNPLAYSSDVVYGPFMIDNVAPAGTIRIVDASGNDITSTSNTLIFIRLTASKDPTQVYLSETESRPTTAASFPTVDVAWDLINQNPSPPDKTLYAWFADNVGNISSTPAIDAFTLLAPVSISPNTATIDLASGGTQAFRVEGTTDSYTWAISDTSVAVFTGGVNTGNSVTVTALKTGTFTISTTAPTALTSGTITVVQSVKPGDVNGDGEITLDDVKLSFGFLLGASSTSQQFAAANVYDDGDGNTSISLHDVKGVFTLLLGGTL